MSTQDDVRRIACSLPGAIASTDRFAFSVEVKGKAKAFVWVWMERVDPKKPRVPQPAVLAVRVADENDKAALLDADPDKFFTEPHYNGYPAVLVRLANVNETELRRVLVEAWRCMAPRHLVAAYGTRRDAGAQPGAGARPAAARSSASKPGGRRRVATRKQGR